MKKKNQKDFRSAPDSLSYGMDLLKSRIKRIEETGKRMTVAIQTPADYEKQVALYRNELRAVKEVLDILFINRFISEAEYDKLLSPLEIACPYEPD